jgi:hypothetical protein
MDAPDAQHQETIAVDMAGCTYYTDHVLLKFTDSGRHRPWHHDVLKPPSRIATVLERGCDSH